MGQGQRKPAEEPAAPFTIPVSELGGYEVERTLGKGAFGEVLLVHDKKGGRYALKQVMCRTNEEVNSAMREAHLLKQLNHPAIVGFKEVKKLEYKGRFAICIIMEYVEGCDLQTYLHNTEETDTALVMKWFLTLLDGLCHIHKTNIVHRDLKPSNILIDEKGNLKIADFGVSALKQEQYLQTVAGTLPYMCPEMLMQQAYDGRADVWALGCILYEVVMGRTLKEMMFMKLAKDPELLSHIEDFSIRWILSKMLQQKEQRMSSEELLNSDVVKGWNTLLNEEPNKMAFPPSTHFLMPFMAALGTGSSLLRAKACQYLGIWIKITKVHKSVMNLGMEPLCQSLQSLHPNEEASPLALIAKKETLAETLLLLNFMADLCNRRGMGRACAMQLYSYGALSKLAELCRSSFSAMPLAAACLDQLLCLVVRYEGLYFVLFREEGFAHLLHCWLRMENSPRFVASLSLFTDVPYLPDHAEALNLWAEGIQSRTAEKQMGQLVRLCNHRTEPEKVVEETTLAAISRILMLAAQEVEFKDEQLEALLLLLRSWNPLLAQAYLYRQCTYEATGQAHAPQLFFYCKTCWPDNPSMGCCLPCLACHRGHKIRYNPPNHAYCDCGAGHKCQLRQGVLTPVLEVAMIPETTLSTPSKLDSNLRIWKEDRFCEVQFARGKISLYQPIGFDLSIQGGQPLATAFYYEVEILQNQQGMMVVGLSLLLDAQQYKLPGTVATSWGYHGDDGFYFDGVHKGACGPTFSCGDVVGCGVTWNGSVYYTINGIFLGIAHDNVIPPGQTIYATIGWKGRTTGTGRIRFISKPPFKFAHGQLAEMMANSPRPPYNALLLDFLIQRELLSRLFLTTANNDVLAHLLYVVALHDLELAAKLLSGLHRFHGSKGVAARILGMIQAGVLEYSLFSKPTYIIPNLTSPLPAPVIASTLPPLSGLRGSYGLPALSSPPTSAKSMLPLLGSAVEGQDSDGNNQLALVQLLMQAVTQSNPQGITLPRSVSTQGGMIAILVKMAHSLDDVREASLGTERTLEALEDAFWVAFDDCKRQKISKIEKCLDTGKMVPVRSNANVQLLKENTELVFHILGEKVI